jgi:hypothetical protein
MDPKTGAIAQFETDEDAEKAGYTERLSPDQAKQLMPKNRHDRRAELARMRKSERPAHKYR